QVSQINPISLREFFPEHSSGVCVVLKSHFKHNHIRNQTSKFQALIETIPPSLIVQFSNIIQSLPQISRKILKLLSYNVPNHHRPSKMKLLTPGESFNR
ncbi:unnamed protein product, partial [Hymenolepis diminuta]